MTGEGEHLPTPTTPGGNIGELRRLLGPVGVIVPGGSPRGTTAWEHPARGKEGRAAAVVLPATTAEVSAVVRWAVRHGVGLVPQGANTGLVGASTPDGSGTQVVLSTDRLRSGTTIDPDARTVIASAGLRLDACNELAAPHGLMLGVDLGADPSLGGMVATNTGGSRMLRYGDMRSHLLGLEFVRADPDGTVIDLISTSRKNNAGLPLAHLLCGSGGALGIITRVALSLDPLPAHRAVAWVAPGLGGPVGVVGALEATLGPWLSAVEWVSRSALDLCCRHMGRPQPFAPDPLPDGALLVELSGPDPLDDTLVAGLHALGDRVADARVVTPEVGWALRHGLSDGLKLEAVARGGGVVGFDVSVPRAGMERLLQGVSEAVGRILGPGACFAPFGHLGDGGLHCNVVAPAPQRRTPDDPDPADLLRDEVAVLVTALGGSFSAEHGIGPANSSSYRAHTPPGVRALTTELCALLDPAGVLLGAGGVYRDVSYRDVSYRDASYREVSVRGT